MSEQITFPRSPKIRKGWSRISARVTFRVRRLRRPWSSRFTWLHSFIGSGSGNFSLKAWSASSSNNLNPMMALAGFWGIWGPITPISCGCFFYSCTPSHQKGSHGFWCSCLEHKEPRGASERVQQWHKTSWHWVWGLSFSHYLLSFEITFDYTASASLRHAYASPPKSECLSSSPYRELHTNAQLKVVFRSLP